MWGEIRHSFIYKGVNIFSDDSTAWSHAFILLSAFTLLFVVEKQEAVEDDLFVIGVIYVAVSLTVLEGLEPNLLSHSQL